MSLKHWWAWGIDHSSRKPVPVFDLPLGKEMLPKVQSKPPLRHLWVVPTHPLTGYHWEEITTSSLSSPPQEPEDSNDMHQILGTGLSGVDQTAHEVFFSVSITVNARGRGACCSFTHTPSRLSLAPFKANDRRGTSHLLSKALYTFLHIQRTWKPLTFRYKYLLQSPPLCFVSIKFLRVSHKAVYGWTMFWHIS